LTTGIGAALAFALSSSLTLAAGIQSAPAPAHPVIEVGVDASIRPGDDFFAYANGGWLEATQIPEGSRIDPGFPQPCHRGFHRRPHFRHRIAQ
jgi:hypothetical protein